MSNPKYSTSCQGVIVDGAICFRDLRRILRAHRKLVRNRAFFLGGMDGLLNHAKFTATSSCRFFPGRRATFGANVMNGTIKWLAASWIRNTNAAPISPKGLQSVSELSSNGGERSLGQLAESDCVTLEWEIWEPLLTWEFKGTKLPPQCQFCQPGTYNSLDIFHSTSGSITFLKIPSLHFT